MDSTSIISTKGKIRYSQNPITGNNETWWIVVDCDCKGLLAYYRHLFSLSEYRCKKLSRPIWGEHITINYGQEPPLKGSWLKHSGVELEILINPIAMTANAVYWYPVINYGFMAGIRLELGLTEYPINPFHLCLGYYDDGRENNS
jgi:hypothetical protein